MHSIIQNMFSEITPFVTASINMKLILYYCNFCVGFFFALTVTFLLDYVVCIFCVLLRCHPACINHDGMPAISAKC